MKDNSLRLLTTMMLAAMALASCADPVTAPELTAVFAKPAPGPSNVAAGVILSSTGIVKSGDALGEYTNGVCGVNATLFYAGSNDMTMQTDSPSASDKKCVGKPVGSYPRKISIELNSNTYQGTGVNVLNIGSLAVGATENRQVGLPMASGAPCLRVQFHIADGGIPVTRNTTSDYTVAGSAPARCVQSDGSFTTLGTLQVNFTVKSY